MTHNRETARAEIARLEELVGGALSEVPVHVVDQWGAGVRDMFTDLGVKLDSNTARAALGGAYIMATLTLHGTVISQTNAQAAAHVLRWLFERGEDDGA